MKIKVCGLRDPGNIELVCRLNPDFVGYIFYPRSKRYVGARPDPAIFRIPAKPVRKVGVFVNEEITVVRRKFEEYGLDMVQLHGSEPPEYCRDLSFSGVPVIRALTPGRIALQAQIAAYAEIAGHFLFDRGGKEFGGTGNKFNWDLLRTYSVPVPFILSGGIAPEDVSRIGKLDHKWLYGVDLNSRFESAPGIKKVDLLKHFIAGIRQTEK